MGSNTGGKRGDVRQSALWGSGNRGGEFRSNALWGKGGRGLVTTVVAIALAVPLAAGAASGPSPNSGSGSGGGGYVSDQLKQKAKSHPNDLVSVIVQIDESVSGADAKKAEKEMSKLGKRFGLISGFAGDIRAKDLEKLERMKGLVVTLDAPIRPQGLIPAPVTSVTNTVTNTVTSTVSTTTSAVSSVVNPTSSQLWTHESGVNKLWSSAKAATIAIVDSGIDGSRADFTGRLKAQVNFVSSGNPNAAGDGRGHGTFVAGIAAGNAPGYAGAAPNADIVSLDVMDDSGSGKTSDVIAAAEWIYQNKAAYNIRVANFSLHSGAVNRFWLDPLNVAVSKLWNAGIVVVAAAGNYGNAAGPSGVPYAPGSNPFVITVGAVDIGGTARPRDDSRAPWSAYGRTPDGFWKPEICAPGRYMVGPIPAGSSLAVQKADKMVGFVVRRALRDVVRGAGDLGHRRSGPRPEPDLDAGSGQGCPDAPDPSGAPGSPAVLWRRPGERGAVGARHQGGAEPEPRARSVPEAGAERDDGVRRRLLDGRVLERCLVGCGLLGGRVLG